MQNKMIIGGSFWEVGDQCRTQLQCTNAAVLHDVGSGSGGEGCVCVGVVKV